LRLLNKLLFFLFTFLLLVAGAFFGLDKVFEEDVVSGAISWDGSWNLRAYYSLSETSGTSFDDDGQGTFTSAHTINAGQVSFKSGSDCQDGGTCIAFDVGQGSETSSYFFRENYAKTMLIWADVGDVTGSWKTIMGANDNLKVIADSSGNIECQIRDGSGSWTGQDYGSIATLGTGWHLFMCGWDEAEQELFSSLDCGSITTTSISGEYGDREYSGIGGATKTDGWADVVVQHAALFESVFDDDDCEVYKGLTDGEEEVSAPAIDSLVLDLSFDSVADCGNDDAGFHTDFSKVGTATCISDLDVCKWYGCLNLSVDGSDYLSGSSAFTLTDDLSVVFWVYPTQAITGSSSQGFYAVGVDNGNFLYSEEGDYGLNTKWDAVNGEVGSSIGSSFGSQTGVWTHYAIVYNGTRYIVYQNGVEVENEADAFGNLNYSISSLITVGLGKIDAVGYMDEFKIYNNSLNATEVLSLYDDQRAGTPPELDLIVESISVDDSLNVMYDFSSSVNALNLSGTIPLSYSIKNTGILNDSGSFNVTVYVNDVVICDDRTTLTKGQTKSFTCQLAKSEAFISGYVKVDSYSEITESAYSGGDDDNNVYLIHYDMRAHPKIIPPINITYVSNSGNALAYNVYTTFLNFVSDNFNPSWSASSVDPRGKKGYENALSCMLSGYSVSDTACTYAWNHLEGWLVDVSDWGEVADDVQAYHDTHFVAATYDIMFPNMTKVQADKYSVGLMNICTDLFGMNNVRPDLDDALVFAGNGKGFGSGMAYPCLAVLGEVDSNPSSYYVRDDFTTATSTVTGWLTRVDRHLMGDMNGSGMPEGYLYWNYALYHLVGLLYYDQQTDIMGITSLRQEDICGRGESLIYYYLDNTYNGQTIRGDQNNNARFLSFGDTHSYDDIGEMDIVGASLVTQLALLCDDADIKSALYSIRDLLRSDGSSEGQYRKPLDDIYFYELLEKSSTPMSQANLESKFFFEYEDAWGKAIFRDGYDYENDTVVVVDGGDMPSFGHPNAEFDLTVYALGEPFLDQPQVPNEDDVRSERWHNTLSFSDSTANGYLGTSTPCGYALNQYYGGATSPSVLDYPDGTYMSDSCRGVTSDYFGKVGLIGGVKMAQPYLGATGIPTRKILMYDDVILDYYDVTRSSSGLIQFNWLNIYDEFVPTISTTDLSFARVGNGKKYELSVLDSTLSLSLSGGDTDVVASKRKTDAPNLNVNYSHYRHYGTGTSADTLFLHHWYDTTDTTTTAKVTAGDDIGVKIGSDVYLLMDVDGDGVDHGIYSTDGWSLIINSTHVGSNGATQINKSGSPMSLPSTPFSGMVVIGAASACTYTSGNFVYSGSDNCVLTGDVTVSNGATISIVGAGTFTGVHHIKGASVIRLSGGVVAKY